MIYLTNGNMPLNAAYADEIVQEDNSTYQLTFRFPTSDSLWEQLKEETFLTADDLHGEQDFVIFEVEKKHGYIQVYANQVFTLLNNYVVNPISLDRQTGSTALSRFAGAITRNNPFSFFLILKIDIPSILVLRMPWKHSRKTSIPSLVNGVVTLCVMATRFDF